MSKAILVVSFGTTVDDTREKNITAVENTVAAQFPDYPVYRAWTSSIVLKRARDASGNRIFGVTDALHSLHSVGVTELFVLPTHLLYGDEYDKLCALLRENDALFERVELAPPLLCDTDAMKAVLATVVAETPLSENEALVLVGHGTRHFCNTVYAALDYLAKASGMPQVFVGTIEAFPGLDTAISAVAAAGYRKAVLVPLMLVAGDHAINDIASDEPESWKSRFNAAGIGCRALIKGLGEYEEIRRIYAEHVGRIIP